MSSERFEERDDSDGQRDSLQVEDVDSLNRRERLLAIHRGWERAMEGITLAEDAQFQSNINPDERKAYARHRVEQLLIELSALGAEASEQSIWYTAELGSIRVDVPEEIQEFFQEGKSRLPWGEEPPEPKRIEVEGLDGYLNKNWPVAVEFEGMLDNRGRSLWQPQTVRAEAPISMSRQAMKAARRFMSENGIDFETGAEVDSRPDPI